MNIQTQKIQLTKALLNVDSGKILNHIKAVLSAYKTDLWDELSDDQKNSVKKAKAQLSRGEGKTHEQVMKKYKKWLTK